MSARAALRVADLRIEVFGTLCLLEWVPGNCAEKFPPHGKCTLDTCTCITGTCFMVSTLG